MKSNHLQRGATLLIALVLLVMLALLGLTAFRTSATDVKSSGNMQMRTEALNAAQQAIETAISTPQFVATPANAITTPCGAANTFCADYDGDGTPEYTVVLTPNPTCITNRVIKSLELNLDNTEDLGCAAGQMQQFGIAGATTGDSLCANTVWDVTAQASSAASGAKSTVSQGVGIRVGIDDLAGTCL
jgi:Tfp pilus assembly protein PilX